MWVKKDIVKIQRSPKLHFPVTDLYVQVNTIASTYRQMQGLWDCLSGMEMSIGSPRLTEKGFPFVSDFC